MNNYIYDLMINRVGINAYVLPVDPVYRVANNLYNSKNHVLDDKSEKSQSKPFKSFEEILKEECDKE